MFIYFSQAFDHQEAVIGDLQNHLKVTLDRSSDYDRDEKVCGSNIECLVMRKEECWETDV